MTEGDKLINGCLAAIFVPIMLIMIISMFMQSTDKPVTADELSAIRQIDDQKAEFSIKEFSDSNGIFSVRINLNFVPRSHAQVAQITNSLVSDILTIFKAKDIQRDISVWAERPENENFIRVFGNSFYSHMSGELKYKPKN